MAESSVTYPNVAVKFGLDGIRETIIPGPGETARFDVGAGYIIQPSFEQAAAAVRAILGH